MQVGRALKALAEHSGTLEAIEAATAEELTAVGDIGDVTAKIYSTGFQTPCAHLIKRLKDAGVNMTSRAEKGGRPFCTDLCLTGALRNFTVMKPEA